MAHAAAERDLQLAVGTQLHGFTVERVEEVPEIEGTAYVMRHAAHGTPLMWLANDDENKSFAIAFKTPPADDTGVFHILEHSVLCGSDRYPVKEPFVNLLKSSMQTFLNALTFSDKTMYPVASTNEQDLLNLMDVYMDAVLHPMLYRKREIFEQEGWHYEVEEGDGDVAPALRYNGVVLNEMKGALADPDEVVLNRLNAALFPDTAYGHESGGNPRAIPQLTYEGFLDTHARHYNLANARIVLYGDMSLERELRLLDERYLSCPPRPAGAPNPLELQAPVVDDDAVCTMATPPENAAVMLGYVFGTYRDRTRCLAAEILADALMGSNEAPLKRTLLDAGLGCDVDAFVYDGLLQPFFAIELRGAKPGAKRAFRELVESEFARMAREGVPRENLVASLEAAAFGLRERDFGYADGVALAINAMSGWLYDDGMPCDYLRYEDALAELRAGLEGTYWEDLVRDMFVGVRHRATAELVPLDGEGDGGAGEEEAELAHAAADMGEGGLAAVRSAVEALRAAQDEPDTPEALATLPRLGVSDIGPAREEPAFCPVEGTPLPCLHHEVPTRRIDYVYHYFDLSCLTWDELHYATLAATLLGKMATANRTAAQLDTLIESRLGRLSFSTAVYEDCRTGEPTPWLVVGASALAENVADLAAIPSEVWSSTDFGDTGSIRTILQQQRLDSEQAFANAGHTYALARAWGYTSKGSRLAQHFGNVDYYRFVRRLLADWDARSDGLPATLADVCRRVFAAGSDLHSFTGERADMDRFWEAGGTLRLAPQAPGARGALAIPEPAQGGEAFVVPSDVCFVAKAASGRLTGAAYSGTWPVAAQALNYGYLWNEIRVKGGAYGCGFRVATNGNMGYYTFRDPNLDASLERMDRAGAWLASFEPEPREMEGYVVSTVASHDAPQKPRLVARRQDGDWLAHREAGWRERVRAEELAAEPGAVRALAPSLDRLAATGTACVFGSRDAIERSRAGLRPIDLFGDGALEE